MTAAIKLYMSKSLVHLTYGAPFSILANRSTMEKLQSKFLKAILSMPTSASNALVRLETGLVTIEARLWITVLSYWLKLNHSNTGLAHLILKDDFVSPWLKLLINKLGHYGFSQQYLLFMNSDQAKSLLKEY